MDSARGTCALPRVGFPIRKSPDQRLFSSSPRLIAAIHVLHRLLVPRHPPCALVLLIHDSPTFENTTLPLCSFQGTARDASRCERPDGEHRRSPGRREGQSVRSLKTQQHGAGHLARRPKQYGVDIDSRRVLLQTTVPKHRNRVQGGHVVSAGTPAVINGHRIPRKEVIQPQLPLRLPCYDFTPVTNSTFDRSLPCGLGHGLRVSPASVV